ncbi:MAG TPA: 2-oxoglutarate dehydrogenase complex dihydrolipoyllysine-residue succinyltransferase [Gammaproteobacteria bacterium]|nr:2-oxoglutarate dehydrogenase complex dihydrolipoyllysine-residue succinyltransferase [Gammaproteobacteria bacterium]
MLVEVKVPVLAESVTEATLLSWHKQVGDHVKRGDNLIDLETDKVTLEVTAPEDGVIKQIIKHSGETAGSNEVLAIIDTEALSSSSQAPEPQKKVDTKVPSSSSPKAPEPQKKEAANEETKLGPAVRKLVAEYGIEPATIPTSGKQGRLTKGDVLAYLSNPAAVPEQEPKTPPAEPLAPPPSPPSERPERRVAMTRLRRRAAERLLAAQHENAILTTFNEVNMQAVTALRDRYRQAFEKQHDIKLGFMSFFVRATVEALKRFPIINASVDGDDIVYHDYYDLGIAVASARGLVVPVIRDAGRLSFAEIEQRIQKLVEKTRDSSLTLEDLTGGTFTITNGGIFGSLLSTPILNPPQSAILGMHRVQDRPVAENDQVVIRPMMYLALSYDHRIIDGREAVSFLVTIKEQLEDPGRMLLQI